MTVEQIRAFLGWCCVIDFGILMFWFVMFNVAHDWIQRLHGRWFQLSRETFDAIHYAGMAAFKIGIFVLHLVPYLALVFMT